MESHNERRLRQAWETTQDNLELAVGSAYSRWQRINTEHVEPCCLSLRGCFGACIGQTAGLFGRHDSGVDISFDMYNDEAVDADELEWLVGDESDGGGRGGGSVAVSNGRGPMVGWRAALEALNPFAKVARGKERPGSAGDDGHRAQRTRALTVGSTQSSATYRSRDDLGLSDTGAEDAQPVGDNFETSLVYADSAASTSSIVGVSSLAERYPDGRDEDALREEEERARQEEEEQLERERQRAQERAQELGLISGASSVRSHGVSQSSNKSLKSNHEENQEVSSVHSGKGSSLHTSEDAESDADDLPQDVTDDEEEFGELTGPGSGSIARS